MESKSLSNKELKIIRWFDHYFMNKKPIEPNPYEPELEPIEPEPIDPIESELLKSFKEEFDTMMNERVNSKVGRVKYSFI